MNDMKESIGKEGPRRRRKESNRKENCYRDDYRRANVQGSEFAGWNSSSQELSLAADKKDLTDETE